VTQVTIVKWPLTGQDHLACFTMIRRGVSVRLIPFDGRFLLRSSTPAGPQTILVVDDEDIVRELVARSLDEQGYRVLQACHGAGAIGVLEMQRFAVSLVICDLVMPVMGGREVAEWMRQHCPDLPLLFISGYPRAYLEAHHLYDPDVRMLRKPFLPSRLLEVVDELVGPDSGKSKK
jgi:two-component system cell cycle sensor histidine kinase/response regulator CckA